MTYNLPLPVVLHIRAGSITGGGIFAHGLVWALARRGVDVRLSTTPSTDAYGVDGTEQFVRPVFTASAIHVEQVGSECHAPNLYEPPGPSVAVCCFEGAPTDPMASHRLGKYDRLIALSTYTARLLAEMGFRNVPVCHQGYDPSLFYPATERGTFDGSPRIFSGGALQPRKGQDLVLRDFKTFHAEHPQAHLVCAWHSPHAGLARGFTDYGLVPMDPVVDTPKGPALMDLTDWLESCGVPKYRFEIHGKLTPRDLADLMRSCDLAWFPNRCEGATNQLLVEALACGLEVTADLTTGQADVFPFDPTAWTWNAVAPSWRDAIYG